MKFTQSHEWISLQGKIGTVGITDYAQRELGEIVHIEFPQVGQKVKAGEEVCVLESTKAAADVYAPVSGKIVEVNKALQESPVSLNAGAESSAWLFRIEVSDPTELEKLLTRAQYLSQIKSS